MAATEDCVPCKGQGMVTTADALPDGEIRMGLKSCDACGGKGKVPVSTDD